jgi:hypothetical protein
VLTEPRFSIERRSYSDGYLSDGIEWLPRRAALEITIDGRGLDADWYEIGLEVGSGPAEIYRYFPFASYIYVDDRLESIVEFSAELEDVTAYLRVPVGRPFSLTIVSEVAKPPGRNGDDRELSLRLLGMRALEACAAPADRTPLPALFDYYSQHQVRLVKTLPQPVFVIGSYRSGTSILTWAIGQHPNLWALEETGFLGLLAGGAFAGYRNAARAPRNFFEIYDVPQDEFLAAIGDGIHRFFSRASERRARLSDLGLISGAPGLHGERDQRIRLRSEEYSPKRRWVDGTPENTAYAALLRGLFPLAKFVCVVRHPYDAIASMVHFGGNREQRALEDALNTWVGMTNSALLAARAFGPQAVKIVLYDDVVNDPLRAMREIFEFIGEPRYPAAKRVFERRINSSELDRETRGGVWARLEALEPMRSPLPLYETLVSMRRDGWSVDPSAEVEIAERQNDLIERLLCVVS